MVPNDRRARQKAALRERIMAAARKLFLQEGVESVSMRRIAEAIEYSPASIYDHFEDKAALLQALCQADFGTLAAGLRALASSTADPVARIRLFGQAYCRFALDFPCHYRLMFMTPTYNPPPDFPLPDKGNLDVDGYAMLRHAAADAIAAGRVPPQYHDPDLLAQTFWSGVHGVASLHIAKHKDPWFTWRPYDDRAAAMIDALVTALTLPAAPAPVATPASEPRARRAKSSRRRAAAARGRARA